MEASGTSNSNLAKKPRQPHNQQKTFHVKKRRPQKPEQSNNIIYISSKTPVKALVDKCDKLIKGGENELVLYCLGAAIQRGILVGLRVCEQHISFTINTKTFTSELLDDLEPLTDEGDYTLQRRLNSALKIVLSRQDPLP